MNYLVRHGVKKLILTTFAMGMAAGAGSVQAQDFVYTFISNPATSANPDDGSPLSDWHGWLALDAPSSASGSLGDIDLANSYIDTSDGDFALNNPSIAANGGLKLHGTFSWTSNAITSMDITGVVDLAPNQTEYSFIISDSELHIEIPDPTDHGHWVAAPDSAPTLWLFGLAVVGLGGFGYVSRGRWHSSQMLE